MKITKGTPVRGRDGKLTGHTTGGSRNCQLSGCTGRQIAVRRPDGKLTWPCTKGMTFASEGMQIG